MRIGVYSFGDLARGPATGVSADPGQRLTELLEEAVLAEQAGLEIFALGEHHRPDFAVSTPAIVLAAVAARTQRIRLSSAVTVLSSDDPVRVFQEFATLDLISGGRAEIMAGRGSFIESFPLFGYALEDYDALFSEKLALLLELRRSARVTWSGRLRAPLSGQGVYPRPRQEPLPVWVAVGGTPQSVVRAATLGLPMALAIIGGEPARFVRWVALHRETAAEAGHGALPVSINSMSHVAPDSQQAAEEFWPRYRAVMTRIGRERGWPPLTREQYDFARGPAGSLFVGSPAQVTDKILAQHALFAHARFLAQTGIGGVPHASNLRSIELLGTEVAPAVRRALAPSG